MKFIILLAALFVPFCSFAGSYERDPNILMSILEEDFPQLRPQFGAFKKLVRTTFDKEIVLIEDTLYFAAQKHRFQTRKDLNKTPYISHPMEVATQLITLGQVRDPDIIIAALLHDTVEDTDATFEEIKTGFGERVEGFLREVTDDKSLPKAERKRLQIENASHKSAGAAQIKLADKLCNLTDLLNSPPPDWDQERIDAYFTWAKKVVDQLPSVNRPLKQAVDQVIAKYWQK